MFWGSIASGKKGSCLIWDKSWGKITAASYYERIMPLIHAWWAENPQFLIMHDNAPPHRAQSTSRWIEEHFHGDTFIQWPSRSPDLNPIEYI